MRGYQVRLAPMRATPARAKEITAFQPASERPKMRIAASSQPMTGSLLSVGQAVARHRRCRFEGPGQKPHSMPA